MTALILSGTYLESNRYLQSEGIRGRHATSAETVAGTYFTSIIQLPSFSNRPDRHTVASAVKRKIRGRHMDWKVLEEWVPPAKTPKPETFTRSDWLFGSVEPTEDQRDAADELSRLGQDFDRQVADLDAPSAEDEELQDLVEAKDSEPKLAAKPKRTRKPAAPKPTPPKTVTSSIDDLFGDD